MDRNEKSLILFVVVGAVTVTAMLSAAILGNPARHRSISTQPITAEPAAPPTAEQPAAPPTRAPASPSAAAPAPPPASAQFVRITKTSNDLSVPTPNASYWQTIPTMDVPLLPQNITMPVLESPVVPQVQLQAISDGKLIAFRVSWDDATADMNVDAGRFCDAVAIQFPITPDAPFTMGFADARVQIIHWKALWQKDIDEHFQDVQDLHPNYWADLYWFAEGEAPYRVPDSFIKPAAMQWFVAQQAGNPLSVFNRGQPVEELVAEGFGTLTHQPTSASAGRGEWKDGRWTVVFTRPLQTQDPLDYQFYAGSSGMIAIAVWEGASGNVGGRKHWSNWVPFLVAQ